LAPLTKEIRMDNPESHKTMRIGHRMKTNQIKNTTQKTKKMSNTDPTKSRNQFIL